MAKIFNILKKIKIVFKNIKQFIYSLSEDKDERVANGKVHADVDIFTQSELDSILQLSDEPSESIDMQPIKEFFESYLGLVAIDFIPYAENIMDIRAHVCMHMLVGVTVGSSHLELQFEEIGSGLGRKNTIIIRPISGGQFVERQEPIEPDELCLYRMVFFGGHIVDYMNESLAGDIYVK